LQQATEHQQSLRTLLERRHSVRAFLTDPVPRSLIAQALETAGRSPSWCNTQPWQVIVTEGEGTEEFRAALRRARGSQAPAPDFAFPARYANEYRQRRLDTALQLYDAVGIVRGDRVASAQQTAKNFELFGAPHVLLVTTEEDLGVYGAVDCGIFVGSLLLALESLGVGAVPQAALAAFSPLIREHFKLAATRKLVCAISVGWEDRRHPVNGFRTERAPTKDFVTWVGCGRV
jgi:nitroreductase